MTRAGGDGGQGEALRWYLKAAEQGNVYAQFNCGSCYDNGRGTEADLHKAFDWYEKAAEQGHARAQACLGGCYANGKGIWGDYGIAFYWYLKAAQQGHPGAQYSCGVLYQNGCGVEKDEEKALDWYQKAAAQGHEKAKEKVEEIQNTWNEGTLKIAASLLSEFREDGIVDGTFAAASILAKTGYAGAQYLCGMMCYRGEGTEKNIPKARYWLQKAAQSNDKKVAADARNLLRQL